MRVLFFTRNHKGQTAVEYILMVAVISLVILSISSKLKTYLLSDDGNCANPATNKSFICQTFSKGILQAEAGFRTFKLLRMGR